MSKINFYLQIQKNASMNEYKWLPLCNYEGQLSFISHSNVDSIKCELTLVNTNGKLVNTLYNGQIYFLCTVGKRGKKYYLYKHNNVLKFADSNVTNGRIFLFFHGNDTFYMESTNMIGYTFIHGSDISDSKLLWTNTNDYITLKPTINVLPKKGCFVAGEEENNVLTVLSRPCVKNCDGKRCNEDNGCGAPCGCASGMTCKDGKCVGATDPKKCKGDVCSGSCYGKCPSGNICSRVGNEYKCKQIERVPLWLPVLIVIICALLIIALILTVYYINKKTMYICDIDNTTNLHVGTNVKHVNFDMYGPNNDSMIL